MTTPYGRTVIAKIALLFLLLMLGAFNRYVSVPRLQGIPTTRAGPIGRVLASALRPLARDARGALSAVRFMRTVRLEALLLVAVLLYAALLRSEAPRDTQRTSSNWAWSCAVDGVVLADHFETQAAAWEGGVRECARRDSDVGH